MFVRLCVHALHMSSLNLQTFRDCWPRSSHFLAFFINTQVLCRWVCGWEALPGAMWPWVLLSC